jgi:RHS repeat-associated protein
VNYQYDQDGLLTQAGAMTIARDPANGRITSTHLGNVTTSQTYNSAGELESYQAKFGSNVLFQTHYVRDSLGRISELTETVQGNTKVMRYGYDVARRLEKVWRNDTLISSYSYDANGNRLSHTSLTGTTTGTYDVQDRLLSYGATKYLYTDNGDLRAKIEGSDTTRYTYDAFGNLVRGRTPSGDVIEYLIDPQNRRVGKKLNGAVLKQWIYSGQLTPMAEVDSIGNVVSRFDGGYMTKNGKTYTIVRDHLGSVRYVVDASSGSVAQAIEYDEFGNVISNSDPDFQPFAFAGGLYDTQIRLVRFGARDYDPTHGRWTAKDPIGFDGGVSNLFEYCLDDPVNNVDPSGLQRLTFNGRQVTLYNKSGQKVGSYPATSGVPGTTDPRIKDEGPIPEGLYLLDPSEISPTNFFRKYLDPRDWGEFRVPLHPWLDTETFGRENFMLHGGKKPGSIGCIDVGKYDKELFKQLLASKSIISVRVKY